jgi:nitrogen fixation NifU-like protein
VDALYRDYILDHYKNPRNFGELDPRDLEFHDHNPLCGDELRDLPGLGVDHLR